MYCLLSLLSGTWSSFLCYVHIFWYSALDCHFLKIYVTCIFRENMRKGRLVSGMYRKQFQRLTTQEELQCVQKVCNNLHVGIVYRVKSSVLNLVQKSTVRIIPLLWGAQEIKWCCFLLVVLCAGMWKPDDNIFTCNWATKYLYGSIFTVWWEKKASELGEEHYKDILGSNTGGKYAGKEIREHSFIMEEAKISFCSGDS